MEFRIGSFNVRGFKESDSKGQDFSMIRNIILNDTKMQIVALQEVKNREEFKRFLNDLNRMTGDMWDGEWGTPLGTKSYLYSKSAAEGFGFIWNKNYFRCAWEDNQHTREFRPRVLNKLNDSKLNLCKLVRPPFYGRFVPFFPGGNTPMEMEIRLLNVHLMFTKPRGMNEEQAQKSAVINRQDEYRELMNGLYKAVYVSHPAGQMCVDPYVIILGDYNLNLQGNDKKKRIQTDKYRRLKRIEQKHPEWKIEENAKADKPNALYYKALINALKEDLVYLSPEFKEIETGRGSMLITTVQDQLTTFRNDKDPGATVRLKIEEYVKKRVSDNEIDENILQKVEEYGDYGAKEFANMKNNYDHFTYDVNRFKETMPSVRACQANGIHFKKEDSTKRYEDAVSDHLPIIMTFDLKAGRTIV